MGARGKQSSASLSVISADGLSAIERPKPPGELTPEQSAIWREVVNSMPADWFPRETLGLLSQYCRHAVSARRVAQLIASAESDSDFDVEGYDRLLKMQEREGRAMSSLATRMRITQQATYDKTRKKPKQVSKPWEE